ncbi:Signal transduction histidine kinase [Anaerocolumna jejuensis DSM 15929]|uniref:histidine kinase n=1 Tax=Anaerocolumna jejuensis DSM 15929 TaxID=1121322 RepID=A0A1M7DDT8_9FIRM|nr:sensor histidine kinase [Anaerocolumna jejuensis]SHL77568.1 Signal transduction histidine kinase [Anaerocolumna jejuensis DSM 15929]
MFKTLIHMFEKYGIWICSIILLNILFGTMLWLLDEKNFKYIFSAMLLGSFLLYCVIGFIVFRTDQRRRKVLIEFLEEPSLFQQERVLKLFTGFDQEFINEMGRVLREKNESILKQEENRKEYEEYIESWAHEIKTPLALMTFVMDNRRDEISAAAYNRLEYSRTKMQEDIERMLYYARLKSARSDYFFTELSLKDVCYEVIDEYKVLLQEKNINVITDYENLKVFSDRKGVQFLITQVISNAIKYQKEEVGSFIQLSIKLDKANNQTKLLIRDNGIGVKAYDLPFIFEKGFTGEIGEQKKNSTGMGLYLAKQIADHLMVTISVTEDYNEGFEIVFLFPDSVKIMGESKHEFPEF